MFYSKFSDGKHTDCIHGFPHQIGAWCKKLKYEKVDLRGCVLSQSISQERERESIATRQKQRWKLPPVRIPDAFRELVPVRPQAFSTFGFPGVGVPRCTSELKRTVLSKASLRERVLGVRTGSRETSSTGFSEMPANDGRKINIIHYIGIAADEPERIAKHMPKKDKILPLVQIGWEESLCGLIAQYMDMLSPTYDSATRDGCWFCHNQSVGQLRLLRKNYPDLWALLMKWDSDSPVTFHPDGHTVHDFDQRFQAEDDGFIDADKPFRWAMLEHLQYRLF